MPVVAIRGQDQYYIVEYKNFNSHDEVRKHLQNKFIAFYTAHALGKKDQLYCLRYTVLDEIEFNNIEPSCLVDKQIKSDDEYDDYIHCEVELATPSDYIKKRLGVSNTYRIPLW